MNHKYKNWISFSGCAVFFCLALVIVILCPFSPVLSKQGQYVLAALLVTVGLWIFKPCGIPFSVGGLFLAMVLLALGMSPAVVFSGFTQSAVWTLLPALLLGYTLQKTGLGRHLAMVIIRLFRPTYIMLVLAWVVIGIVLSVLTPSMTVRVAIMMPIAVSCCEMFGIQKGSKGNSLIQLSAFSMALLPGAGWLNGSLMGPIVQGMFDSVAELSGMITSSSWFSAAFVPLELAAALTVIVGVMVLLPKERTIGAPADSTGAGETGKWSRDELVCGLVLCLVFVLFLTNRWHKIPDAAVCLLAVVLFYLLRVLTPADIKDGINWDLVLFVGVSLGLGNVFSSTGISNWLAGKVVPLLAPIASNPWVFVYAVVIALFVWRFVDIAIFIPTMAILTPILPAVSEAYGISPLVWITIYTMVTSSFVLPYQNMWVLMSQGIAGERAWEGKHLTMYGCIYFLACLIALLAAVPLWMGKGMLG